MAALIALATLLAGVALTNWPMLVALQTTWADKYGAHSHGYLVLGLSIWFAWRAYRTPPGIRIGRPWWSALPVLVVLLVVAAASEALYVGPSRTAVLPPLILACIALCLGREAAVRLAWPVLFLFFALPIWGPLNEPLRQLTSGISQAAVQAVGIPVYVEGNLVHLPQGVFEIASGCSGLNYFVAGLTLAAVYCTLYLQTWRSRLLLLLTAACAALVANWLRVASLIAIGHATQMQSYLIRVDHLWYGWGLFLLLMIPVHWVGRRLEMREEAGAVAPASFSIPPALWRFAGIGAWTVCAALLLGGIVAVAAGRDDLAAGESRWLQERLDGVVVESEFQSGWTPRYGGAAETRKVWSDGDGSMVEVYVGHYERQSGNARLLDPGNTVTGEQWQMLEMRTIPASDSPDGEEWHEMRGRLDGQQRLLWTRFDVAGHGALTKLSLKLREALGALRGRRDGSVIALQARCAADCARAQESIRSYLTLE